MPLYDASSLLRDQQQEDLCLADKGKHLNFGKYS